jgi:uncharacterized protein
MLALALDRRSAAYDRSATERWKDADGRLHVPQSVISRAEISDYLGREIPQWKSLGLDGNRMYPLYRHPDELSAAAGSFHGIPILSKHVPVSAAAHRPDLVVGVVLNPEWRDPDLLAELVFWVDGAIEQIERAERGGKRGQGLSCGYRYTADMTPGRVDGQSYRGVMRSISANHLAVVDEPRVSSAVVGDSALPRPRITRPGGDYLRGRYFGSYVF